MSARAEHLDCTGRCGCWRMDCTGRRWRSPTTNVPEQRLVSARAGHLDSAGWRTRWPTNIPEHERMMSARAVTVLPAQARRQRQLGRSLRYALRHRSLESCSAFEEHDLIPQICSFETAQPVLRLPDRRSPPTASHDRLGAAVLPVQCGFGCNEVSDVTQKRSLAPKQPRPKQPSKSTLQS